LNGAIESCSLRSASAHRSRASLVVFIMGAGGSVAAAGAGKTVVAAGVASVGAARATAGVVGTVATLGQSEAARQLVASGWDDMKAGTAEIVRDGLVAGTTVAATGAAAMVAGSARALEERSPAGIGRALSGMFLEAPAAAFNHVAQGGGAGSAIVGGMVAAHGSGGSWKEASQRQLADAVECQQRVLQTIQEMGIAESFKGELPLWQLAELAACVYDDPPREPCDFRCDLASIRDPEEEVEAKMSVFLRRGGSGRDLAVLVFRGTQDENDAKRDYYSIIGNAYPGPIVEIAAEIVKMYQGQGCDVMVTGHSLGGYLAEIAATTIGLNGAGFLAPGPGPHDGPKAGSLQGFHTVNHDADNIGNHNHSLHQKPPVYVTDGGPLMLPWNAHSILKMVEYMKKREDWTNLNVLDKCVTEKARIPFHVFEGHRTHRP